MKNLIFLKSLSHKCEQYEHKHSHSLQVIPMEHMHSLSDLTVIALSHGDVHVAIISPISTPLILDNPSAICSVTDQKDCMVDVISGITFPGTSDIILPVS